MRIDTRLTGSFLSAFIANEVQRVGFSRVVVGLSGGIDSALSAYLAVAALGPENVKAIAMPYRTSSAESLEHARLCSDALGISLEVVPISAMAEGYLELVPDASRHRRGNVMARCRMIVLYDRSMAYEALVLGTSNKTELLLGYGTQHGDLASALNPIGDLYKTQVRQLAGAMGVPEPILLKPPSADLWQGQTDEADLGFTYEQVDRLLERMIDGRFADSELIAEGVSAEFVASVRRRVRANQFKRRPPIIAKTSTRTVDKDFHYLRDWGT